MTKKQKKALKTLDRRCRSLEKEVDHLQKDCWLFYQSCIHADAINAALLMVKGYTSDPRLIEMMEDHRGAPISMLDEELPFA